MTNKNSKINKLLKKRCELFAKTLEIDKQLMSLTRNIPKDEQQGKHFFLTIEITNLSKGEEFGGWDLYKYFSGGYRPRERMYVCLPPISCLQERITALCADSELQGKIFR